MKAKKEGYSLIHFIVNYSETIMTYSVTALKLIRKVCSYDNDKYTSELT